MAAFLTVDIPRADARVSRAAGLTCRRQAELSAGFDPPPD
jgi:hypothetical protein